MWGKTKHIIASAPLALLILVLCWSAIGSATVVVIQPKDQPMKEG